MATDAAGRVRIVAPVVLLGLFLAGCASNPSYRGHAPGDGIGEYRVGGPYEINGVWYYPAVDYNYDKTGTASWYGADFQGRLTANGEIFDLNGLTAANTTLPMPSIVRVTNLENGRSVQLRVNDRGPFVDGRLIDVSRRAAQLLGFERRGTTLVRVKILKEESIAAADQAMHNSGQIVVASAAAAASAAPPPPDYSPPPYAPPPASSPPVLPPVASEPAAAPPISPASPPRAASPQIAMASPQAPPTQATMAAAAPAPAPKPAAPRLREANGPLSRFSLISPAEAAPLAPPPPAAKPKIAARPARVPMSSAETRMAGAPRVVQGRVFIQAGAFSVRDNAQRVRSHIARLGNAEVTPTSVNGIELYRVRLGPFESAAQADRLLARVVGIGYPQARIVSD